MFKYNVGDIVSLRSFDNCYELAMKRSEKNPFINVSKNYVYSIHRNDIDYVPKKLTIRSRKISATSGIEVYSFDEITFWAYEFMIKDKSRYLVNLL